MPVPLFCALIFGDIWPSKLDQLKLGLGEPCGLKKLGEGFFLPGERLPRTLCLGLESHVKVALYLKQQNCIAAWIMECIYIQIPPLISWLFSKENWQVIGATDKGGMPKLRQPFARIELGNKVTSGGARTRTSAMTQTQVCVLR